MLYGIPLPSSQIGRLSLLGKRLGPASIGVLVDDLSQLASAKVFKEVAGFPLRFLIKVDTGYHRAGLSCGTEAFERLVNAVAKLETQGLGILTGFYCHAGHSYRVDSSTQALQLLIEELEGLEEAARAADAIMPSGSPSSNKVLSAGASPTTTSIENLIEATPNPTAEVLISLIARIKKTHLIELHAGVYPFLDLQQLATRASPSAIADVQASQSIISLRDVALSILVEVTSVYEARDRPEALIAAGTLALGREPCKSYDGWGIVSEWGLGTADSCSGWQVGRISQEHSILTVNGENNQSARALLQAGQKLRIWPNHACVASAGFSWYLVIDSDLAAHRYNEIVDVWIRSRGW